MTPELSAMFCALKGRTRKSRFANQRQSPAVSRLLPTPEPVPWSITTRGISRKLVDLDCIDFLVQQLLELPDVVGFTHKGEGNEIHVMLQPKEDVAPILLGDRG